jgi:hypothetical protein
MNRRNNNKINNNFKFNNYFKFGITTLIVLTPIGFICKKQLKEILNLGYTWCIVTLKRDIEIKEIDINLKHKKESLKLAREYAVEAGIFYKFFEKEIKKTLPKICKNLLKFLKK